MLFFQGKSCRAEGTTALTAVGADGIMGRTDDSTWLAGVYTIPGTQAAR